MRCRSPRQIDRLDYFLDDLLGEIEDTLIEYQPEELADDINVCEAIRIIVRRKLREKYGKRPLTSVHLVRQETIN